MSLQVRQALRLAGAHLVRAQACLQLGPLPPPHTHPPTHPLQRLDLLLRAARLVLRALQVHPEHGDLVLQAADACLQRGAGRERPWPRRAAERGCPDGFPAATVIQAGQDQGIQAGRCAAARAAMLLVRTRARAQAGAHPRPRCRLACRSWVADTSSRCGGSASRASCARWCFCRPTGVLTREVGAETWGIRPYQRRQRAVLAAADW